MITGDRTFEFYIKGKSDGDIKKLSATWDSEKKLFLTSDGKYQIYLMPYNKRAYKSALVALDIDRKNIGLKACVKTREEAIKLMDLFNQFLASCNMIFIN